MHLTALSNGVKYFLVANFWDQFLEPSFGTKFRDKYLGQNGATYWGNFLS